MRQAGYAPSFSRSQESSELVFQRPGGKVYPHFHVYVTVADKAATLNLHLDQKRPSYKGTSAHGGEYDGPVVQTEAARIQNLT